jgi:hypothetical protein
VSILVLAAAVAVAQYPEQPVIDAFKSVCVAHRDKTSMSAAAEHDGWIGIEPAAGSQLSRVVEAGQAQARQVGVASEVATFDRVINGIHLSLFIGTATLSGSAKETVDCGVYDFAAKHPLSDAVLTKLSTAKATKYLTSKDIWYREWISDAGNTSVRTAFVPTDSQLGQQYGMAGLSLLATYNLEPK